MAGHSLMARTCAVLVLALCWFRVAVAVVVFNMTWNKVMDEKVSDVELFLRNNMFKFVTTGSVHDLPRSGKPPTISDDLARQCAIAFKQGRMVNRVIDEDEHVVGAVHQFYTCMWEAAAECDMIKNTLNDFNVSAKHLLHRMREVDPALTRVRLDFKLELNEQQLESRRKAAADMLQKHEQDPTYLNRIIWGDEWHCWCSPRDADIHVWCDLHDARAREVLPIPQMKKGERPTVIRCIAFVSAILGPVHIEYTTGTDELQRELVDRDTNQRPYLVSVNHTLLWQPLLTTPATFSFIAHAARYSSCPWPEQSSSPILTLL